MQVENYFMKLWSILGNSQKLDGGAMFGNAPRAMWERWTTVDGENRIDLACRALLASPLNGKTVLFETGIGAFFEPKLRERYGVQEADHVLLDSLRAAGFSHEDIDVVVLSHLHFDHAANAKMFDNGKTRIVANSTEIENALAIDGYSQGAHIVDDYRGLSMEGVSDDVEIVPGVSVIQTPGHTWGTMSLRVDLENEGTKLFTSDAVYLADSWGPPAVGAAIVWDNLRWLESVEKLRRIAEETNAEVIFGHDSEQAKTLRYAPNGYYS